MGHVQADLNTAGQAAGDRQCPPQTPEDQHRITGNGNEGSQSQDSGNRDCVQPPSLLSGENRWSPSGAFRTSSVCFLK
ncbi:hypothetical protein MJG53_008899 [Ovis ammon polii x Ovis aries]|uniref:Uncharacterized protein n=1 Tax=Ovis ammon polii x Ovis aries TaxID=2918886 RepID=A0ACB9UXS8_9CETA|nr:hypothetical protein MJT46_008535 [Ovis ammon polii x Ovis aries]KAI4582348.1 hypothetical protein MJG53_008899 [Ovis ammon polii x Ovis aries]